MSETNGSNVIKPSSFESFVVPLKTTKEAEWISQLRAYIIELGEDPSNYQKELNTFNRMRQDSRGAPGTPIGVDIIVQYYRQLDSLSRRLPLAEQPLTMSFTWYDAFDTSNSVKQSSIAFEKANILFNLGAVFCHAAKLSDPARNFQAAASVFTFIADNFLHPPLMDLNRSTLLFLTAAMLAQAQESVVLRALSDGKSVATLSKLAASASTYARDARKLLIGPELADLRSCLLSEGSENDRNAIALIQLKADTWAALSEHLRAEVAYKEDLVGEAIARLKMAEEITRMALDTSDFDNSSKMISYLQSLSLQLKNRLVALEKENSLIYNQKIPDVSNLAPIEGASLVNIMPLCEVIKHVSDKPDLFRRLVPLRVHEEISKYSEEKSKLLRYETLKVTTADTELQTTLTSLGFPNALEELEKEQDGKGLPEEFLILRKKTNEINLFELERDIDRIVSKIHTILGRISEELDDEIAAHQRGRVENGISWNQPPSHLDNSRFFEDLALLQQSSKQLSTRRGALLTEHLTAEARADYALLVGPELNLLNLLPKTDNFLDDGRKEFMQKIRSVLSDLERLSKDRAMNLDILRDSLLADDISDALSVTKTQDTMTLFHQELAKFDEPCKLIEDNIIAHNSVLTTFKSLWSEVWALGRSRESDQLKKDLIQRLSATIVSHSNCQDGLNALRLELDQLLGRAESLSISVENFVERRKKEREEIYRNVQITEAQRGQQYLLEKLKKLSAKAHGNPSLNEGSTAKTNNKVSVTGQSNNLSRKTNTAADSSNGLLPHVHEPSLLD